VKRIGRKEAHKAPNINIFAHLVPFCGNPFAFHPAVLSVNSRSFLFSVFPIRV
jgi:hypothetical protein